MLSASLNKTFPSLPLIQLPMSWALWYKGNKERNRAHFSRSLASETLHRRIEPNRNQGFPTYQPVSHNCCMKCCGMLCPVCGNMHVKMHLLLTENGSKFPLRLQGNIYLTTHSTHFIYSYMASVFKTTMFDMQ